MLDHYYYLFQAFSRARKGVDESNLRFLDLESAPQALTSTDPFASDPSRSDIPSNIELIKKIILDELLQALDPPNDNRYTSERHVHSREQGKLSSRSSLNASGNLTYGGNTQSPSLRML